MAEVWLNVGCDKRLVYEYRIEPMNCDRDALKQECRLACIAVSGTQPPTHLSGALIIIIIIIIRPTSVTLKALIVGLRVPRSNLHYYLP